MYSQPVMVQQPVVMAPPPMLIGAPPPVIVNTESKKPKFDCPSCLEGNLLQINQFTPKTCLIAMVAPCSLCLCPDCAYGKKLGCRKCGYTKLYEKDKA